MQSERGIALITITFLLTVLGLTLAITLQASSFARSLREARVHSLRAKQAARQQLFSALLAPAPQNGVITITQSAKVGRYTIQDSLTAFQNMPQDELLQRPRLNPTLLAPGELMPSFDLKRLAINEAPCPREPWDLASSRTRDGYLLENSSLKAATLCATLPPQTEPVFLGTNLDQESYALEGISLTILGYLNLKTLLVRVPSVFVMAAGDLHIQNLECAVPTGCSAFLISLTGCTRIDALAGTLKIKSFSRLGDNLETVVNADGDYLSPPLEQIVVISMQ